MTDIPVIVPDFTSLADEELHAWEFTVYQQTPGTAELHEIIGVDAARRYYDERGRRIDVRRVEEMTSEIGRLQQSLDEVLGRIVSGTSGQHHFSSQPWGSRACTTS